MSIESVMPSNHLILCRPLLLLPLIFPGIRVFSNESALCIRWPKYWSFSFNISPSDEHPGLISFRMDWLALLAVQETQTLANDAMYRSLFVLLLCHSSRPQSFWHQGLVSWKKTFPWTGMGVMVWGWFKHLIFIMPLMTWQEAELRY